MDDLMKHVAIEDSSQKVRVDTFDGGMHLFRGHYPKQHSVLRTVVAEDMDKNSSR